MILVITACLGLACSNIEMPLSDPDTGSMLTPFQCFRATQPKAAEWQVLHPKHRITRLRCVPAGKDA